MRKALWLIGLLAVLTLVVAGCAAPAAEPAAGGAEQPAAAGEEVFLRLSSVSEPTTLDPNLAEDYYSITPIEQLFIGLTNINNETAEIEPELAESWEASPDGTVWTFNLRQDAVWSDGTPITAGDVVYSVKRAVKPETASPYAYILYIVQNARAINQTAVPTDTYDIETLGVTALDDYTVQFTLEAPAAYFGSISAMWTLRPLPQAVVEEYGAAWTDPANIVVSGPYNVTEWKPGESLTFVKNDKYYNAANVQIDRVELSIITDQNTEVALYESGELDVAGEGASRCPWKK